MTAPIVFVLRINRRDSSYNLYTLPEEAMFPAFAVRLSLTGTANLAVDIVLFAMCIFIASTRSRKYRELSLRRGGLVVAPLNRNRTSEV